MKFSILFALTLTYTTLVSAQKSSNFRAKNAQDAIDLAKKFESLTPDSPCQDGQQACVQNQFAQCVGGKFQMNQCSGGTICCVLPLVNKPGTSITCDTASDRDARISEALGKNSVDNGAGNPPPANNGTEPSNKAKKPKNAKAKAKKSKSKSKSKGGDNGASANNGTEPASNENDNGAVNPPPSNNGTESTGNEADVKGKEKNKKAKKAKKAKGNEANAKKAKKAKAKAKNNDDNNNINGGINNNGTATTQGQQDIKAPAAPAGNNADIQKQNAADAEKLQKQFDTLTPDSKCTDGENACVQKKFAQCANGKFALTPCNGGTQCAALPLVLKKGTTVTCTTEADRQARLNAAKSAKN